MYLLSSFVEDASFDGRGTCDDDHVQLADVLMSLFSRAELPLRRAMFTTTVTSFVRSPWSDCCVVNNCDKQQQLHPLLQNTADLSAVL
jgi:hypothetical protein